SDCSACEVPFGRYEREAITIKHAADTTTISRVTCPTAPRYWQWRDLPWPKLSPRAIEIPDDSKDLAEWKWQLAAAVLCGVFGLAAAFATEQSSVSRLVLFACA